MRRKRRQLQIGETKKEGEKTRRNFNRKSLQVQFPSSVLSTTELRASSRLVTLPPTPPSSSFAIVVVRHDSIWHDDGPHED